MKLFVGGGAGLAATLFASSLIFNVQTLSAVTIPSQQPAAPQEGRQQKQEPALPEQESEHASSLTRAAEPAATLSTKDSDSMAAARFETAGSRAPLTKPQNFTAFSYSLRGRGASGLGVRRGTIAADPRILPYGTRVYLDAGPYSGEYLVTDAGTAIKGKKIDVWVPTVAEARRFGRRNVKLTVLSYGGRKGQKAQGKR